MSQIGHLLDRLSVRIQALGRGRIARRKVTPVDEYRRSVERFVLEVTGEKPDDWKIYAQALTHSSYAGTYGGKQNERLEYLGDSLLGAVIAAAAYRLYPDEDQGGLTQIRSFLVSRKQINKLARSMGIDRMLRVSPGVDLEHSDVPGNALEAFIGALYLDKGFEATADFVKKQVVISRKNLECVSRQEEDYKSTFIIRMQKEGMPYLFDYLGETEEAPGEVTHHVALRVGADGVVLSEGSGPSKKAADRMAARTALRLLDAH